MHQLSFHLREQNHFFGGTTKKLMAHPVIPHEYHEAWVAPELLVEVLRLTHFLSPLTNYVLTQLTES